MRNEAQLLLLTLACLGCSANVKPDQSEADTRATTSIPTAFIGRWGRSDADCEVDNWDTTEWLEVGLSSIDYYETPGAVTDIALKGQTEFRATVNYRHGEMQWDNELTLAVQNNRLTLYGLSEGDTPLHYDRCDPKTQKRMMSA